MAQKDKTVTVDRSAFEQSALQPCMLFPSPHFVAMEINRLQKVNLSQS